MNKVDMFTPRRLRVGTVVLVALLHILLVLGLVRAFAPDFASAVVADMASALRVTVVTPSPTPEPSPEPGLEKASPEAEGAAAPAGQRARPRDTVAPRPKIELAVKPAPKVAAEGSDDSSGARDEGADTGAGGDGIGTGAGISGSGPGGGGVAAKAVKIAGEINSARDYPRSSRDLRIGDHVIVALTVSTKGRVTNCRILRPSRDPEADRITCRLATERFRFRPAMDASGDPVESVFGWKQRWFYPGED